MSLKPEHYVPAELLDRRLEPEPLNTPEVRELLLFLVVVLLGILVAITLLLGPSRSTLIVCAAALPVWQIWAHWVIKRRTKR